MKTVGVLIPTIRKTRCNNTWDVNELGVKIPKMQIVCVLIPTISKAKVIIPRNVDELNT